MAAIVISQLTQALSFLREHPNLACVLLLLLSSPIYRILLYFTPLLLSTALCIFALITLTPYVTATDAEVERQSMLGASSQKFKKKTITSATTSISNERKREDVSGYGHASSSSSASSASSSLPSSSPSSSAAETSWISWMKGLNDIGRTWMENKLTEQGLALSEPANRETLLAFIEGSFADLISAQENPSAQLFAPIDSHGDAVAVAESACSMEKNDEVLKASTIECVSEAFVLQKSIKDEDVVCAKVSSMGDDRAMIENVVGNKESTAAKSPAATITTDVCGAVALEHSYAPYEVESLQEEPLLDDVKMRKEKLFVVHESSLPVMDSISDMRAATIMPRTPSRIPAPSKLLEASRRIFSKEEQSKTMVPRAPLQASSGARVNQPFKSSFGNTQNKMESSASLFKLPARKFLERSRSIPSKEGSKLSTSTTSETQAAGKVVQGKIKESDVSSCFSEVNEDVCEDNDGVHEIIDGLRDANDGVTDVRISDVSDFACGAGDNGPRFDEDLEVEEAQALVQSELKMLEVELEEVAAKLPKLDEAFAYQKTPVRPIKSVSASLTSASPTFKTS